MIGRFVSIGAGIRFERASRSRMKGWAAVTRFVALIGILIASVSGLLNFMNRTPFNVARMTRVPLDAMGVRGDQSTGTRTGGLPLAGLPKIESSPPPAGVWYFEQTHFPFLNGDNLDELDAAFDECMWTAVASPPGPLAAGEEGKVLLREGARRLRQETDRAIIGLFGGNLLESG